MAKTLALLFGVIFVLVGLLGFVGNPLVGTNALFDTNGAHNILHALIGLILLGIAFWYPSSSALWLKIVGVFFLLLAILGFLTLPGTGSGSLLGLIEFNGYDNWLHLVLGIVILLAGIYARNDHNSMGMMNMPSASEGM